MHSASDERIKEDIVRMMIQYLEKEGLVTTMMTLQVTSMHHLRMR